MTEHLQTNDRPNIWTYALCTFTSSLQTFTIFFQINAFINVYYNFFWRLSHLCIIITINITWPWWPDYDYLHNLILISVQLTCRTSVVSLARPSVVFTLLLVHLTLCTSPHYSHHLRSHHLGLPLPRSFTPDLKLISFTNSFRHGLSSSWTCTGCALEFV